MPEETPSEVRKASKKVASRARRSRKVRRSRKQHTHARAIARAETLAEAARAYDRAKAEFGKAQAAFLSRVERIEGR